MEIVQKNLIDLGINNCWIVELLPFDTDTKSNEKIVSDFQQYCYKEKIFGIGWANEGLLSESGDLSEDFCNRHIDILMKEEERKTGKKCEESQYSSVKKAYDSFIKVKNGDFILTRLRNSCIYLGKAIITEDRPKRRPNSNSCPELRRLSWYCNIEEWYEFETIEDVPSEIVGRLSQRRHPTIQRIANERQQILIRSMYNNKTHAGLDIPKIRLTKNNFARSLTYMELEDLVAFYISNENKDYEIKPSSCKIAQQGYEFIFVKNGCSPISCQVKNQERIVVKDYESAKGYSKIYLFSGRWNDDEVKELKQIYSDNSILSFITPSDLFDFLKDNSYLFANNYYSLNESVYDMSTFELSDQSGFHKVTRFGNKEKKVMQYKICTNKIATEENIAKEDMVFGVPSDWVRFGVNNLFYSNEVDSLIWTRNENPTDDEKIIIEKAKRAFKDFNI